jgi:hypothetical protein
VDADHVTGTPFGYDGATPNVADTTQRLAPNIPRGWETNQVNTSGTVDFNLIERLVPERARRLLPRSLHGHRCLEQTSYTYLNASANSPLPVPATLQGARARQYAASADHRFDTTKRENFNLDYNHAFAAAASTPSRRLWLPARQQRHQPVLPGRIRPDQLGHGASCSAA